MLGRTRMLSAAARAQVEPCAEAKVKSLTARIEAFAHHLASAPAHTRKAYIRDVQALAIATSDDEVQATLWVPLSFLEDERNVGTFDFAADGETRARLWLRRGMLYRDVLHRGLGTLLALQGEG